MSQTISVSCKLQVHTELRQKIDVTLKGFADACNQILVVAKKENLKNVTKLHHLTYYQVKAATGLKANHVCQALRRVVGNMKEVKCVHKFRPTSLSLDVRTFTFRESDWTVGITLKDGRAWLPLHIGNYQRGLLKGQSPTSATLVKRKNGDYYIQICVEVPTQPPGKTPKVIGVDLGRRDIAYTSTGKSWNGAKLSATRERFFRVRQQVQSKRTRSSRRLLRRLSGKERRFQKWLNHSISAAIVKEAKQIGAGIALEDLSGIRQRAKVRGKKQRRQHHSWAFYQLRQFLTYKAVIAGISLVLVPAAYTSKTCSRCQRLGDRKGKDFSCGFCGLHIDADWNGSLNISALGLSVNQPEIPGTACRKDSQLDLFPTSLELG